VRALHLAGKVGAGWVGVDAVAGVHYACVANMLWSIGAGGQESLVETTAKNKMEGSLHELSVGTAWGDVEGRSAPFGGDARRMRQGPAVNSVCGGHLASIGMGDMRWGVLLAALVFSSGCTLGASNLVVRGRNKSQLAPVSTKTAWEQVLGEEGSVAFFDRTIADDSGLNVVIAERPFCPRAVSERINYVTQNDYNQLVHEDLVVAASRLELATYMVVGLSAMAVNGDCNKRNPKNRDWIDPGAKIDPVQCNAATIGIALTPLIPLAFGLSTLPFEKSSRTKTVTSTKYASSETEFCGNQRVANPADWNAFLTVSESTQEVKELRLDLRSPSFAPTESVLRSRYSQLPDSMRADAVRPSKIDSLDVVQDVRAVYGSMELNPGVVGWKIPATVLGSLGWKYLLEGGPGRTWPEKQTPLSLKLQHKSNPLSKGKSAIPVAVKDLERYSGDWVCGAIRAEDVATTSAIKSSLSVAWAGPLDEGEATLGRALYQLNSKCKDESAESVKTFCQRVDTERSNGKFALPEMEAITPIVDLCGKGDEWSTLAWNTVDAAVASGNWSLVRFWFNSHQALLASSKPTKNLEQALLRGEVTELVQLARGHAPDELDASFSRWSGTLDDILAAGDLLNRLGSDYPSQKPWIDVQRTSMGKIASPAVQTISKGGSSSAITDARKFVGKAEPILGSKWGAAAEAVIQREERAAAAREAAEERRLAAEERRAASECKRAPGPTYSLICSRPGKRMYDGTCFCTDFWLVQKEPWKFSGSCTPCITQ
jgi:hypothetical protein